MSLKNSLDNPATNDNRLYEYNNTDFYIRAEFPIINDWVKDGMKIIDLGCGNGSLMKYLSEQKKIIIEGLEISSSGVDFCRKNGFRAQRAEIDRIDSYRNYSDRQFDYVICNVTLQMLMYPEVLMQEASRIASKIIVSFPNFAYLENRLDLLFNGVMPRPMLHKYSWFNTGHIHQLSLKDFRAFCKENKIKIIAVRHLGCFKKIANFIWPNLFSKESIFLCQKYDL